MTVHNYRELLETNVYVKLSSAVTAITPQTTKLGLPVTCRSKYVIVVKYDAFRVFFLLNFGKR